MVFKNKHDNNEENFWLSATDMMAALSLFFIFLLMLVVLFLNTSKDDVFTPLDATETVTATEIKPTGYDNDISSSEYDDDDDDDSGGGGGGEGATEIETQPPTEHTSGGYEDRKPEKSAVLVVVIDADTGNIIKKKGVEFELYYHKNGLSVMQVLYSYYPDKVEHRRFETSDQGVFYLPEKVSLGWYSLHNIVPPTGYYFDEEMEFNVDEVMDWPEPYVVTVPMKPIKKNIRVFAEESETGKGLEDVTFEVVAAEKIVSADGTVRFENGEVVDKITTDENGFADSRELYVGDYYVREISAPDFYAVESSKLITSTISDNAEVSTGMVKVKCTKSAVTIKLTDQRTEEPISGAVYVDEDGNELETDNFGQIKLKDLHKSTTYRYKVASLPEGYTIESDEVRFMVDADGLIHQQSIYTVEVSAYTISLGVEVKDLIFGRVSSGIDMELLDDKEKVVDAWTTNDKPYIITGLHEGTYYVQRAGDKDSRMVVYISDTADLQNARMRIWDTIDIFAILMSVGVVIIAGIVIVVLINRRKKGGRKRE